MYIKNILNLKEKNNLRDSNILMKFFRLCTSSRSSID